MHKPPLINLIGRGLYFVQAINKTGKHYFAVTGVITPGHAKEHMLKKIVAAGTIAVVFSACNTQNALTEYNQPSDKTVTMADVIPVLQPASPQEKQQQEKFIKQNIKRFHSAKVAGAHYVQKAKRTFNEQKLDSAAYLFGRAWLLDSTNNDIRWGYGLVYGQQKQFDKALFILYKALEADKENPRLLTDVATSHLGRFYEESALNDLLQSRKLLEQAVKLAPDNVDAYYKLAVNSYYLQEYRQAWNYLHKCLNIDKDSADKTFIAALLEKHQDPEGVYKQNIQ